MDSNKKYWQEKYDNAKAMLDVVEEGTQLHSDALDSMLLAEESLMSLSYQEGIDK